MATITDHNSDTIQNLLTDRILVLDGAMGSLILDQKPQEEDYRGERFKNHDILLKNCNDILNLTQQEMILDIHRQYFDFVRRAV